MIYWYLSESGTDEPGMFPADKTVPMEDQFVDRAVADALKARAEDAEIRIRELEAAIIKFWDYSKFVLPMPVHPAVGAIMEIGRELASTQDRGGEHEK